MKRKHFTNACCPKCGETVLLTRYKEYSLYCNKCNQFFTNNEVNKILGDWFEITMEMNLNEFEKNIKNINDNFNDTCFIGYDTVCIDKPMGVCDIGFENIPDNKRINEIIAFFNLKVE